MRFWLVVAPFFLIFNFFYFSGTYHSKPAATGIPCSCAPRWSPWRTTSRGFHRWWRWWWQCRRWWTPSSNGWAGTHQPAPIPGRPAPTPRLPRSDPWPPPCPRANRRAGVYPGASLKTPSEQSACVESSVWDVQEWTDDMYNDLYDSFSPPLHLTHTFFFLFYTSETEQVFIETVSRSNGHPSLVMTPPWACSLGTFHQVWSDSKWLEEVFFKTIDFHDGSQVSQTGMTNIPFSSWV